LNKKLVGTILLLVTIFGMCGAIFATGLSLLGVIRVTSIQTEAMSPTLPKGSLAVSLQTPTKEIKPGDIISVRTIDGNNEDTLGRVETIQPIEDTSVYSYTLKSDGNPVMDEWLYKTNSDTYKLIFSTPIIGHIAQLFKTPLGAVSFFLIIITLVVYYLRVIHGPESLISKIEKADKKAKRIREENEGFGGVDQLSTWFTIKLTKRQIRARKKALRLEAKQQKKDAKASEVKDTK